MSSLLDVNHLTVAVGGATLLDDVSFGVAHAESVALVGASGSGKSTLLHSLLGWFPQGCRVDGSVKVEQLEVVTASLHELRQLRGKSVALVPQDATGALDPVMRIGAQLIETLRTHERMNRGTAKSRAAELLASVGLDDVDRVMRAFPHRLSGGQCQRVSIAMAMAHDPALLLFDEPTSALDEHSTNIVVELIENVRERTEAALVMVTHDEGVARRLASRTLHIDEGHVKEIDLPAPARIRDRVASSHYTTRCAITARNLRVNYGRHEVLRNVTLDIFEGEVIGVIGDSGSGKSTFVRSVAGMVRIAGGTLEVDRTDLDSISKETLRSLRSRVQLVFQDPYAHLDPRLSVVESIREFLLAHDRDVSDGRVVRAMSLANVDVSLSDRLPHQLSGGQCQRVCIARALVGNPKILLLDEPTSALDSAAATAVVETIRRLRHQTFTTCVWVSHDIANIAQVADRVAVMHAGTLVEVGRTLEVFGSPSHPATRSLVEAAQRAGHI